MPKLTRRCQRRDNFSVSLSTTNLTAPPRKVSFEDAHSDNSFFSEYDHYSLNNVIQLESCPQENEMPQLTRRTALVRPKSSLSLVDLAKSAEGETLVTSFHQTQSTPVSPIVSPTISSSDLEESSSPLPIMPSSPWGQFVDTVIPDDRTLATSSHRYCDTPCIGCSSCRRRRAYSPMKPYGTYKKDKLRPLCFLREIQYKNKVGSKNSKFRLAPRKEPTEVIIGALDRLQFR